LPTKRRDFLARLASTSLLAAAPFATRAEGPAASHPAPLDDKFDLTWVERVEKAKFRAVFDSPEINDGDALFRAIVWCDQYKEVYGTPRADMAPVLVFRHRGISLIMSDGYWKRFQIGKEKQILNSQGKKWAEANPISAAITDANADVSDYNIQKFISDGGIVLACNFAFGMVVSRYKESDKLDSAAARQEAMKALIPGVILQPSGIFGVLRAEEAGCKYIMAS
jgi:hypothetical protein